jgi:hypothetical protein
LTRVCPCAFRGEQFEQQLHREVVYGSLTHAHKKSLHRQAARLITTALNQQQASQRAGANQEIWSLLQALAKHSLEVVKTGASDATYADLETASNSQMHAAEYLMAIGDIKGAWVFKVTRPSPWSQPCLHLPRPRVVCLPSHPAPISFVCHKVV